jgi:hypothetical protein
LSGRFIVPNTTDTGSVSQLTQVQINAQNGAAFQARVANYGSDTLNNFLEEVSVKPFTDADGTLTNFRVRLDGIGTEPDTSNFGLLVKRPRFFESFRSRGEG